MNNETQLCIFRTARFRALTVLSKQLLTRVCFGTTDCEWNFMWTATLCVVRCILVRILSLCHLFLSLFPILLCLLGHNQRSNLSGENERRRNKRQMRERENEQSGVQRCFCSPLSYSRNKLVRTGPHWARAMFQLGIRRLEEKGKRDSFSEQALKGTSNF